MNLDEIIKKDNLEGFSKNEVFDDLFNIKDYSSQRLNLCFELFFREPTYHMLHEMYMDYSEFSENEKIFFWSKYGGLLEEKNSNDCLELILYSLRIDFFGDANTEREAWTSLIEQNLNKNAIKRILEHSGPVSYRYKSKIYKKYLNQIDMHQSILISLYTSLIDFNGMISFEEARNTFIKLDIKEKSEIYCFVEEYIFNYNFKNVEGFKKLIKKYYCLQTR
ncbi:hypothetical protein [Olleya sp. Bg11-27]|uniref:hypothetical protein n=1 Tax=Olleya sp. Bg11-27 TaxID=2058135 RepID=UPI000C315402|nr:hypothetical protein [Olleya sp. Bg11-27]AUC77554.1 hypothetical protein CW732_18455 [Olleya sp. Bg11-27]